MQLFLAAEELIIKKKILLWFSKTQPSEHQLRLLKVHFGKSLVVTMDLRALVTADDIVKTFQEGGYHEIAISGLKRNLVVIAKFLSLNIHPLWINLQEVSEEEDADMVEEQPDGNKVLYRFVGFNRVLALDPLLKDL